MRAARKALSTAQTVDIGVSDVYATSCPTVTAAQLTAAKLHDYNNFFAQVMEFGTFCRLWALMSLFS